MRACLLCLLLATAGCSNGAPASTERDEVEQFIVAVRACVPRWFLQAPTLEPDSISAITLLVDAADFRSRTMAPYRCVIDAGSDCVGVRACYGLRSDATSGPCMGAPPLCDGDTLVLCVPAADPSPTQIGLVDCAHEGLSCLEADVGGAPTARCASARCDGRLPPRCDGTASIACDGFFETREEAPTGMTCTQSGGFVHFVGDGEPCTTNECVGTVFTDCDLETHRTRSRIDCSVLGQSCSEASFIHCFQEDPQCSSGSFPSCTSSSVVSYCGTDGLPRTYDCVAHGFAGCEDTFVPDRGLVLGGCTPTGARF